MIAQFVGLQIEYSLIERTVERELVPIRRCQRPDSNR
jgi:hypothetical protein